MSKMKIVWFLVVGTLFLMACSILPVSVNEPIPTDFPGPTQIQPSMQLQVTCPTCQPAATCAPTVVQPSSIPPTAVATISLTNTPNPASPTPPATLTPGTGPTKTRTPTLTLTKTSTLPPGSYQIQKGSPVYMRNFAHSNLDCNWMGVAGQVFNKSGKPVTNLVMVLEGFLGSQPVDAVGLTGSAKAYGPGGYEIQLSNKPVASTQSLFISVYDLAGNRLSNPVAFDTFSVCEKNLIVINFKQK